MQSEREERGEEKEKTGFFLLSLSLSLSLSLFLSRRHSRINAFATLTYTDLRAIKEKDVKAICQ